MSHFMSHFMSCFLLTKYDILVSVEVNHEPVLGVAEERRFFRAEKGGAFLEYGGANPGDGSRFGCGGLSKVKK